jgi:hypothetical protein
MPLQQAGQPGGHVTCSAYIRIAGWLLRNASMEQLLRMKRWYDLQDSPVELEVSRILDDEVARRDEELKSD